jgi:cytochrome c
LQSAAVVWTESVLDTFIESPRKVISNTTMTFMGEPDAQRRAEIINYLKSLQ